MVIRTRQDEIEVTELRKLINNKRVRDIRKYNMEKVEETLRNGGNVRTTRRRLEIGRRQLFALKDANGNVTTNMDEVVRVAENFYSDLYSDLNEQEDEGRE